MLVDSLIAVVPKEKHKTGESIPCYMQGVVNRLKETLSIT